MSFLQLLPNDTEHVSNISGHHHLWTLAQQHEYSFRNACSWIVARWLCLHYRYLNYKASPVACSLYSWDQEMWEVSETESHYTQTTDERLTDEGRHFNICDFYAIPYAVNHCVAWGRLAGAAMYNYAFRILSVMLRPFTTNRILSFIDWQSACFLMISYTIYPDSALKTLQCIAVY